eukprot:gene13871-15948_t
MYVNLISSQDYTLTTYSFHKVSSALLFAGFSITISDWAGVLYDINEYELQPFLIRKATLIGINVLYALVSLTNFIFCYTLSDFDSYTNSGLYLMGIFFQIATSLILTLFMLSAGLKLAWRIHGVSGARNDLSTPIATGYSMRITNDKQLQQFTSALWNLNIVMSTCAVCIILQTVLLVLDYALGYANSTSKTVGPTLFYWTCYFWLPLWGVTCSLLYLSRTHSKRSNQSAKRSLNAPDVTGGPSSDTFCNPLITSLDRSNPYYFTVNNGEHNENDVNDTDEYDFEATGSSRSRPESRDQKPYANSYNSQDPRYSSYSPYDPTYANPILRLNSDNAFSEGQLSGHTDVLFTTDGGTDVDENEQMFGTVFSPDNSLAMYRDSSMFSPAISTMSHLSPQPRFK